MRCSASSSPSRRGDGDVERLEQDLDELGDHVVLALVVLVDHPGRVAGAPGDPRHRGPLEPGAGDDLGGGVEHHVADGLAGVGRGVRGRHRIGRAARAGAVVRQPDRADDEHPPLERRRRPRQAEQADAPRQGELTEDLGPPPGRGVGRTHRRRRRWRSRPDARPRRAPRPAAPPRAARTRRAARRRELASMAASAWRLLHGRVVDHLEVEQRDACAADTSPQRARRPARSRPRPPARPRSRTGRRARRCCSARPRGPRGSCPGRRSRPGGAPRGRPPGCDRRWRGPGRCGVAARARPGAWSALVVGLRAVTGVMVGTTACRRTRGRAPTITDVWRPFAPARADGASR